MTNAVCTVAHRIDSVREAGLSSAPGCTRAPVATADHVPYAVRPTPSAIRQAAGWSRHPQFETVVSFTAICATGTATRMCAGGARRTACKLGASVKMIADLLRDRSLDTASTYARIDLEHLRAVALPWCGSQPRAPASPGCRGSNPAWRIAVVTHSSSRSTPRSSQRPCLRDYSWSQRKSTVLSAVVSTAMDRSIALPA